MSILDNIPGANQSILEYALRPSPVKASSDRLRRVKAQVRQVISDAAFLEPQQRLDLLQAIEHKWEG